MADFTAAPGDPHYVEDVPMLPALDFFQAAKDEWAKAGKTPMRALVSPKFAKDLGLPTPDKDGYIGKHLDVDCYLEHGVAGMALE
jgi:hypothetical protein